MSKRSYEHCTVDGCPKPIRARGWCCAHYARWRKYGTTDLPEQPTYASCMADGCDKPPRSKRSPHCEAHYYRMRRRGTLELVKPQRERRGICTVDGCGNTDCGLHGLCDKHYARSVRNGHPLVLRGPNIMRGPDNPHWTGDDATYSALHQRVKKERGRPSQHQCVDCGRQAQHWSYNHEDPNEKFEEGKGAYSLDIYCYDTRCVSCHKQFDLEIIGSRRGWYAV